MITHSIKSTFRILQLQLHWLSRRRGVSVPVSHCIYCSSATSSSSSSVPVTRGTRARSGSTSAIASASSSKTDEDEACDSGSSSNIPNSESEGHMSKEWIGKLLYNSYFASIRVTDPNVGYRQTKLIARARRSKHVDEVKARVIAHQNQVPIAIQMLVGDYPTEAKDELLHHGSTPEEVGGAEFVDEPTSQSQGKLQFPYRILTNYDLNKIVPPSITSNSNQDSKEMEQTDEEEQYDWYKEYGSPDSSVPASDTPCGGCGAILHCQDTAIPGYMPSERFKILNQQELDGDLCQRCYFLKEHNAALNVNISRDDYPKILSQIKDKRALALCVVDLLDFPCSIWPGIVDIIGKFRPVILVGNKVDLLPQDSPKFLNHVKECLEKVCEEVGLDKAKVIDVQLVSATTGYGIESLISSIFTLWGSKGDIYIMGCTNVGKSSLFNAFLQSDLCKVRAVDIIQRATISQWPGTTLNLLKFPVTRTSTGRMGERAARLREESYSITAHKELRKIQLRTTKEFGLSTLVGHVGRTFVNKQKVEAVEKLNEAKDLFHVNPNSKNHPHTVGFRSRAEMEQEYVNSKWCFDTPGAIAENQILDDLTLPELILTIPKEIIRPRTFIMKEGWTLFVAGLSRIDYIHGSRPIRLTLFTTKHLPVTIVLTDDADYVYNEGLGSIAFGVPFGDEERLAQFPPLEGLDVQFEGDGHKCSCGDIVISSTGWVAVTAEMGDDVLLRAHTPKGKGLFFRRPSLLPYAVNLKGKRIRGTPAYHPTRAFL